MNISVLIKKSSASYELLDSGDGEKLERFGTYVLRRPDPQVLWKKNNEFAWNGADAFFSKQGARGSWAIGKNVPERWQIEMNGLYFYVRPTSFKHTGIFPEQASNWNWIEKKVSAARKDYGNKKPKILNLFGYTGGATLAAAKAGAEAVHVDGSKVAISWAKENAELSGLGDAPIRYILDDARSFVKREVRRGNRYDGIVMDPPTFGRGAKGEVWKLEEHFSELFDLCASILSDTPIFFLVNGYAAGYSSLAYKNNLEILVTAYGGVAEAGELAIEESGSGRLLPAGIYARWSASRNT